MGKFYTFPYFLTFLLKKFLIEKIKKQKLIKKIIASRPFLGRYMLKMVGKIDFLLILL